MKNPPPVRTRGSQMWCICAEADKGRVGQSQARDKRAGEDRRFHILHPRRQEKKTDGSISTTREAGEDRRFHILRPERPAKTGGGERPGGPRGPPGVPGDHMSDV